MFNKVVTITDLHFGRRNNSHQANQDNIEFLEWAIEEARIWGATQCIMMGDWHDRRDSLHVSTLHYSLQAMEMLNAAFEKIHWIPGNHDLYYRDKRDVSSIEFSKHLPNISIIKEPTTVDGVTLLPWLVGDEHTNLKSLKSRYVFGHLELGGFMMNAKVEMPEHSHHAKASHFVNQEYVFSGHFHMRQQKGNVIYTGNIFPFDFSDNWDEDRGIMLLEWGKEPEFRAWKEQPLFRTMTLTDMLENPKKFLKPKTTVRANIDMEISYEEAQLIRDNFISDYQLRKIELIPQSKQLSEQDFAGQVVFQSVDQIVVDGLVNIQMTGMKPDKLVEIYKTLPNL